MTPKQKDRIITGIVVAAVIGLMVGFGVVIYLFNNGSMDYESMLMVSSVMSGAMFLIVIIYAVFTQKLVQDQEKYKRFEQLREEEMMREQEEKSEDE